MTTDMQKNHVFWLKNVKRGREEGGNGGGMRKKWPRIPQPIIF
jgi:hypothetical protein